MRNQYIFLVLIVSIVTTCSNTPEVDLVFDNFLERSGNSFDILIHNGSIINGLDTNQVISDILIKDDLIAYIGEVDTGKIDVDLIINAEGKVVTPGFIDAHAHGDPLSTPAFENFLRMGVTTITLGQDGSSPSVKNIGNWMSKVDASSPGVNIAMFVGHGTLRHQSGIGYKSAPSDVQLQILENLLQNAFDAGCFGMSTGLEYNPGNYAGEEELIRLAKIVGQNDGIIMSHVRNEDDDALINSIKELLRQGEHCKVHVAHIKSVYGKGAKRAEEILELIHDSTSTTADIYPYNASYTGIGIVFPKWAKRPNDYEKVKRTRRNELLDFLKNKIQQRNGPEATLFGTGYFAGRTLKQLSDESGRPYDEILLDIGPNGASGAYMVMDENLQERLFQDENVMVSSDGSPTMRHPRGYGTFAKIIEAYVLEKNLVSLPVAIHKMTGLTANTLQIRDRGIISEGKIADLLVFDPSSIKAKATFVKPKQLAVGFDWVIINGKVAIKKGELNKKRHGKVLKKKH